MTESDTSISSENLQELQQTSVPVSYQLQGDFNIKTLCYLKDISEINRRSSIIISCHLLFGKLDFWTSLRPYVASNMYNRMSLYAPSFPDFENDRTSCWYLNLNTKSYILSYNHMDMIRSDKVDDFLNDNDKCMTNQVEGCQELVVGNESIVMISYKVKIICDVDQMLESLKGYKLSPEPHYSWIELIRNIDKAHDDPQVKKFFASLADKVISLDVRCNPIAYVSVARNN